MTLRIIQPLVVLLFWAGQAAAGEWTISGQYQYLFSNDAMYWANAQNFCLQKKSTAFPARPTNDNADFLKGFGTATMYWADHSYDPQKGWVWSDGMTVGNARWHNGYPQSPYTTYSKGMYERATATLMNTAPSGLTFGVVCQAPLDPTTPAPPTTSEPSTSPSPSTPPQPSSPSPSTPPQPSSPSPSTPPQPSSPSPSTPPQPSSPSPSTPPQPSSSSLSPTSCPSGAGWTGPTPGDSRCYYLSSADPAATPLTWPGAYQACKDQGSDLASAPDVATFYTLSYKVTSAREDAWVGLLNINGGKTWTDGSTYKNELERFFADGSIGLTGFLSAEDGLFHLSSGSEEKAYVCYIETSPEPSPTPTSGCPADWEQDIATCYFFSEEKLTATGAAHQCYEKGGDLVIIGDLPTMTFLLLKMGDGAFWTGLRNQNTTYVWEDGSDMSEEIKPYLDQWEEGKDCVALDRSLYPTLLVHDGCFAENAFICQKSFA